jgi:GNAT superfamily N-acetyltransferase
MARLAAELGYPMPLAEMERRLERLLRNPRHHIVVASAGGGQLFGWIHVEHRTSIEGGERAELMGLVVDPAARRRGIRRELVDAAESWTSAKGLLELTVRSNAARDLSHPFYEALGYVRQKTQHVYVKAVGPPHRTGGCLHSSVR